jgi:CheY-like chemotaxis protein
VPRILLAEPDEATRGLVRDALTAIGLEVIATGQVGEATRLFASERPDAVVLAAHLADGEPLARQLREADPRLLLVVIDRGHVGRARGIQAVLPFKANGYVSDPTGPELTEKLTLLLSQQAAARSRLRGAALVLSRAPAAHGEIKAGVVARLVHQVWRSLSAGVLVLHGGGPERRFFFLRGQPVAFETDDPRESLAGWFQATGRLDDAGRAAVREGMVSGLSPSAALVAAGALEPGEPVLAALREHTRAQLVQAVGADQGDWRFHAGDEFAAQVHAAEVAPLPALLEGARANVPAKHFADALKGVLEAFPGRAGDFERLVPSLALEPADQARVAGLDGHGSTRAFLEAHKADLKEALSLLWFLSLIGAVVFHGEAATGGGTATGSGDRPPLPADRAEAIRQAALRILPGTYFHALGVDIAAEGEELESAWREVSARFDPAGFADFDVGDVADLLRSVQDKVDAAHRVLSVPDKRRHYLSFLLLKFELSGVRAPGIVLDAEVALTRGERALRARRGAEAVAALRDAVALNPHEPVYQAMYAFAALHEPGRPAAERAEEARRAAQAALDLDSGHVRGLVVLALAEQLAGRMPAARAAIDAALRAQPYSDIARKVHLRLLTPAR